MTDQLPVLYSFRRCPYAIRARMAIFYASIPVEVREVSLSNKPKQMLAISPKGTVPVLHLCDGGVIDESLGIMQWALTRNDPEHWLRIDEAGYDLIKWNDGQFKYYLDRYKYADRYPEFSETYYRQQAESFIAELDARLAGSRYLCGNGLSLADTAIFPFIRQFSRVNALWFQASGYHDLKHWLDSLIKSDVFLSVMNKYPIWKAGQEIEDLLN